MITLNSYKLLSLFDCRKLRIVIKKKLKINDFLIFLITMQYLDILKINFIIIITMIRSIIDHL